MRFSVHCRKLNATAVRETQLLPRMEDCIQSRLDSAIFSTANCNLWDLLDLNSRLVTQEHHLLQPSWFIRIYSYAVRTEECTEIVSTSGGHYTVSKYMAIRTGLLRPCYCLLEILHGTLEVVTSFWSNTVTETKTEHNVTSTVLEVKEKPVTPDPFTLREFVRAQKKEKFCRERAESVGSPQSCLDYIRCGILVKKSNSDGSYRDLYQNGFGTDYTSYFDTRCQRLLQLKYSALLSTYNVTHI